MTTSGTSTFSLNRDQIIKMAMRKLGVIAAGETPDAQSIQDFSDQLNIMVKAWMASGIHLWTVCEAILFVQIGQIQFSLSASSSDVVIDVTQPSSYTTTTLGNNAVLNATSIGVTSTTGAAVNGRVGVTRDDGGIDWRTITSIVGTTISFTIGLTDSATSGLNVYYVSGSNMVRPLRIPHGRRWSVISDIETPLIPMSRLDYEALPNKTNTGNITQFYYNPQGGANAVGLLSLWPAPVDTVNNQLKFTYYRPIQDFTAAGQIGDFPVEWTDAMMWNLAKKMAPEYDCPPPRYQIITSEAASSLDLVVGWDREATSTYFGCDFSQSGG